MKNGSFNKETVDTITAFAAAITLYGNAQRSGVITNLTIPEFRLRQDEDDEKVVIPCCNHKTASQRLAQLVVTEDGEELLLYYLDNIRQRLNPQEDAYKDHFFLSFTGNQYTQVYRRIKEALSVNNIYPPVPSEYRVLVSSDARRYLGEVDRRSVVKHLSHSMQTSEKYYEFMTTRDAKNAHGLIQHLSMTRRWSRDDIAILTEWWPLSKSPPSLKACKTFVATGSIQRSSTDILNKWKQLSRHHKIKAK